MASSIERLFPLDVCRSFVWSLCRGSLEFLCLDAYFIWWSVCLKIWTIPPQKRALKFYTLGLGLKRMDSVFLMLSDTFWMDPTTWWVADRCREGCREGCREYFRRSLGGGRDVGRVVGNIPDAVWVAGGMIAFALGASVPLIGAH
jgi:hypothetical protein